MREILRTSDPVTLSYVESVLAEAGIGHFVADKHISTLDGLIDAFPFRVMVDGELWARARQVLIDAGLEAELPTTGGG